MKTDILVHPDPAAPTRGTVTFGDRSWPCSLGRSGVVANADKREGDGATPAGRFLLRELLYRADRLERPACALPVRSIAPLDGWNDDPASASYNRPVPLPCPESHERLWREDDVYDLIVPLGYNDDPPVPGCGSAIFLHVAREGFPPTAGCVAMRRDALQELLRLIDAGAAMEIAEASALKES